MAPDQIETISDSTHLLVDQQDVTPLGLAYQAIELQTTEDAARRRAAPRPAGDEGLTVAGGIIYLDIDDEITSAAARIRAAEGRRVGGRAAVRLARRDVADQLPAAGARRADPREAAVDRGGRRGDPGARRVRRAAGVRLRRRIRGVRGGAATAARRRRDRDRARRPRAWPARRPASRRRPRRSAGASRGRRRRPSRRPSTRWRPPSWPRPRRPSGRRVHPAPRQPPSQSPRASPPAAGERRRRRGPEGPAAPPGRAHPGGRGPLDDDVAAPAFVAATTSAGIAAAAGRSADRGGPAASGPAASGPAAPEYAGTAPSVRTSTSRPGSARRPRVLGGHHPPRAGETPSGEQRSRRADRGRDRPGHRRARPPGRRRRRLHLLLPSATIVVTPKEESVGPVADDHRGRPVGDRAGRARGPAGRPGRDRVRRRRDERHVPGDRQARREGEGDRAPSGSATRTSRRRTRSRPGASSAPPTGSGSGRTQPVTVPRADIVGPAGLPEDRERQGHRRRRPGPEGNVEPNTIVVIPRGEDPISLDVNNPDATSGGKRDEFPKVTQEDVDAALAALAARSSTPRSSTSSRTRRSRRRARRSSPRPACSAPSTPDGRPGHARRPGDRVVRPRADRDRDGDRRRRGRRSGRVAEERLKASIDAGHHLVDGLGRGRRSSRPSSPAAGSASRRPPPRRQTAILDPDELEAPGPGQDPRRGHGDPRGLRRRRAVGLAGLGLDRADARRPRRPDGQRRRRDRSGRAVATRRAREPAPGRGPRRAARRHRPRRWRRRARRAR